jgi:hypothetical protein
VSIKSLNFRATATSRHTPFLLLLIVFFGSLIPKFIGLELQSLWVDELNIIHYMGLPSINLDFFAAIRAEPHWPRSHRPCRGR